MRPCVRGMSRLLQPILIKKYPAGRFMRTFSGIQPTGAVHLGNYLGAIRPWSEIVRISDHEKRLDNIFCIVDMHAITFPKDPAELRSNITNVAATLLACGLDPKKCVLFQQSAINLHAEMAWLLTSLATVQSLSGLSQYKDKSAGMKEIPLGLFMYPVLQAADILLYKGAKVPVGEDQIHHIELARRLARSFNNKFCPKGGPLFPLPRADLVLSSGRVRSLRDPEKKMSKSDRDTRACLYVTDDPDTVVAKCKKALTDLVSEVTYDPDGRLGVSNLVSIMSSVTDKPPEQVVVEAQGLNTGQFKLRLADALNEHLQPIRVKIEYYLKNRDHLDQILREGNASALDIASETMAQAKRLVGFN